MRLLLSIAALLVALILGGCSESPVVPAAETVTPGFANPFSPVAGAKPATRIQIEMPEAGHLRVVVWNALGDQVRVLADRAFPAGPLQLVWNGTNEAGNFVASGVYYYTATTGGETRVGGMVMIK